MRVRMTRSDGWAEEGWTGEAVDIGRFGGSIVVLWDNGKKLSHIQSDIEFTDNRNPNIAFIAFKMRKNTNERKIS
jgi:hypothetical protein